MINLKGKMQSLAPLSDFLLYLSDEDHQEGNRIPALTDLSREMRVSVATLREQMEVARALGFVEVRPRTGIRRLPYTFRPAAVQSCAYAIAIDPSNFEQLSDLRSHIEAAYWFQAVSKLLPEDHQKLQRLVSQAIEKLNQAPPQIPHVEHRELHLTIYRRLGNPFVLGLLEAYWEMYEAVGLAVYTDIDYLQKVWKFHARMVEDICAGNDQDGYQALLTHVHLISERKPSTPRANFE